MKKKLDAMTVISVVLIVITWITFIINRNTGSSRCGFDDIEVLMIIFEQLFGGIVYASNKMPPLKKISTLDGIMRGHIRAYTNNSLCVEFNFDCTSNNKVY